MPAWDALLALLTLLKTIPSAVVAADHIGQRQPSSSPDLPRVVASAGDVRHFLAGIGGVVGSRKISNTSWAADTGSRTAGTFAVELWAADEATLTNLATAVLAKLDDPAAVATAGFGQLSTRSIGPMELTLLPALQPGGETALRLPIGCDFAFEAVIPTQAGPDGIILSVHVDVHELDSNDVNEAMDLP